MLRLKYERTRRCISQAALGAAAKVHQGDLAQIERGNYIPPDAVLERLGRVLDVPAEHLLTPVKIVKPEEAEAAKVRDLELAAQT